MIQTPTQDSIQTVNHLQLQSSVDASEEGLKKQTLCCFARRTVWRGSSSVLVVSWNNKSETHSAPATGRNVSSPNQLFVSPFLTLFCIWMKWFRHVLRPECKWRGSWLSMWEIKKIAFRLNCYFLFSQNTTRTRPLGVVFSIFTFH